MQQCVSMPAPDGAGICTKLGADLLPRIVMDVAVLQNQALVGVRNRLDHLPDLLFQVGKHLKLPCDSLFHVPELFKRPGKGSLVIP